jgi:NADPH:quinone reductase-like Zn-dependent oxidoreductase
MKAARIHRFGPPDVIVIDEIPRPTPGDGEVLVRVAAAGVGPWDAIIREGKSKVSPQPPLILGSDLSGVVEAAGPGVGEFAKGDEVYGVTNPQFCGATAEYALAKSAMIAHKPERLTPVEAASAPVVAVTAWQMLFEYANAVAGQTVLVLGAAGNVGAYVVQLAVVAGVHVIAVVRPRDNEYMRSLGVETCLDSQSGQFEANLSPIDAIIDLVGGTTLQRSLRSLKKDGIVVSVVSDPPLPESPDYRSVFFYVDVTTARLNTISKLFAQGKLRASVGTVLPLERIREAHKMLAGVPHDRGKIVVTLAG